MWNHCQGSPNAQRRYEGEGEGEGEVEEEAKETEEAEEEPDAVSTHSVWLRM